MRLVRARRTSDEEYDIATDDIFRELDQLDPTAKGAAIADLIAALVRVASVVTLQAVLPGIKEDKDVLDIAEQGLIDASLDV